MKKKYELVVKGITNYGDKITVTVKPEGDGQASLLSQYVVIDLERVEGATLEFYEAEAKKQAKQFFMDIAAGLREGDDLLTEKRLRSEALYTIKINSSDNTIAGC
ncbi:TPA: DUF1327 domain-containing protein [Escherichia coli]|nr:DUF1327 domain-containing protein [Escherichia coli]HAW2729537.1 DUF1327 domain-containing protein [Escherichia coli]